MGWIHDTGYSPAFQHDGYPASVLADGTDTSESSSRVEPQVVGWRAACEGGWRGKEIYSARNGPAHTDSHPRPSTAGRPTRRPSPNGPATSTRSYPESRSTISPATSSRRRRSSPPPSALQERSAPRGRSSRPPQERPGFERKRSGASAHAARPRTSGDPGSWARSVRSPMMAARPRWGPPSTERVSPARGDPTEPDVIVEPAMSIELPIDDRHRKRHITRKGL